MSDIEKDQVAYRDQVRDAIANLRHLQDTFVAIRDHEYPSIPQHNWDEMQRLMEMAVEHAVIIQRAIQPTKIN